MTGGKRYVVVECRRCHGYWVTEDLPSCESPECPNCGHPHQSSTPRVAKRADDWEDACEIRSQLLAEQAEDSRGSEPRKHYRDQLDEYEPLDEQEDPEQTTKGKATEPDRIGCSICGAKTDYPVTDKGCKPISYGNLRKETAPWNELDTVVCSSCWGKLTELIQHWDEPANFSEELIDGHEQRHLQPGEWATEERHCFFCSDDGVDPASYIVEYREDDQHPGDRDVLYSLCVGCDDVFRAFVESVKSEVGR